MHFPGNVKYLCVLSFTDVDILGIVYVIEPDSNGVPRQNSMPTRLSLDSPDETYTKGVDVQQISVTGEQ